MERARHFPMLRSLPFKGWRDCSINVRWYMNLLMKIDRNEDPTVNCDECDRSERFLLEAMVAADKAETALRCYLMTHERFGGVSDMDEYEALRGEQQNAIETRHGAYTGLVRHKQGHCA